MSDQVLYIISCQGLCTHKEWLYREFQFTVTDFMSMAAKMSNRGDNMTESNLQADGLVEEPAQRAADQWETEAEDSSPQNLPTWSPVQRLPTGCFNTNYFLSIQVTLTDELGDVLPPLHAWMAPVVEDMLQETRAGLTEAVVIGPGRPILFYGRHSMGEGLKVDKARDAAFLLTLAGTWVGKLAYLTTGFCVCSSQSYKTSVIQLESTGMQPKGDPMPKVASSQLCHLTQVMQVTQVKWFMIWGMRWYHWSRHYHKGHFFQDVLLLCAMWQIAVWMIFITWATTK